MFIRTNEIFTEKYNLDVVTNSIWFDGVETIDMKGCDVIALIHRGREIIFALPAYYTDKSKTEIIIDDHSRNLKRNFMNKITVNNIHTIKGHKFTCVTLNLPEDRRNHGKYYSRDNWL